MRALFVVIAVVAIGYLAWSIYREWQPSEMVPSMEAPGSTAPGLPSPSRQTSPNSTAPYSPSAPATTATTGATRPGVFYVLERVSIETPTGVKALRPGEEVRLMYRNKNGTMLVTDGNFEFTVPAKVLTQDPQQVPR